jgi:hypothetical protein
MNTITKLSLMTTEKKILQDIEKDLKFFGSVMDIFTEKKKTIVCNNKRQAQQSPFFSSLYFLPFLSFT